MTDRKYVIIHNATGKELSAGEDFAGPDGLLLRYWDWKEGDTGTILVIVSRANDLSGNPRLQLNTLDAVGLHAAQPIPIRKVSADKAIPLPDPAPEPEYGPTTYQVRRPEAFYFEGHTDPTRMVEWINKHTKSETYGCRDAPARCDPWTDSKHYWMLYLDTPDTEGYEDGNETMVVPDYSYIYTFDRVTWHVMGSTEFEEKYAP
jgi:hypothetical protein